MYLRRLGVRELRTSESEKSWETPCGPRNFTSKLRICLSQSPEMSDSRFLN